jgi:hypothetical protein
MLQNQPAKIEYQVALLQMQAHLHELVRIAEQHAPELFEAVMDLDISVGMEIVETLEENPFMDVFEQQCRSKFHSQLGRAAIMVERAYEVLDEIIEEVRIQEAAEAYGLA